MATAGDVNGDGYSDVIIGATGYDNGQTDEGRAFVYLGAPSGLSLASAWTADGGQDDDRFGYRVATAGDVNGDGYADVIVGAPLYDHGQTERGDGPRLPGFARRALGLPCLDGGGEPGGLHPRASRWGRPAT